MDRVFPDNYHKNSDNTSHGRGSAGVRGSAEARGSAGVRGFAEARGFTVVEVIVAVSILLIAVLAFTPLLQYIADNEHQNRTRLAAAAIASQQVEEIRAMDYGKVGYDPGAISLPPGFNANDPGSPFVNAPGSTLAYEKVVTTPDAGGVSYHVYNDIRWNDPADRDFKQVHIQVWAPSYFGGQSLKLADVSTNVTSLSAP